jgi:Bifunctional DNA primase/polymerase, N-terminal
VKASRSTSSLAQVVDVTTLVPAALEYVTRGWAVFPCHTPTLEGCSCGRCACTSAGKHPRTRNGVHDATTDRATVAGWWRRWPRANVAVATGETSGVVVVDIDARHGGAEAWRTLMDGRPTIEAPVVATGAGWHLWFAHPRRPIPNSAGLVGAGLDIRGDGGYVIAPPSFHPSGRRYRWQRPPGARLPVLPHWLEEACRPSVVEQGEPVPLRAGLDAWARAALRGEIDQVRHAVEGTRNVTLNRAAFRLGQLTTSGILDEAWVADVLLAAALDVGLEDHEAVATIRSGMSAGHAHPRHPPRAG